MVQFKDFEFTLVTSIFLIRFKFPENLIALEVSYGTNNLFDTTYEEYPHTP